MPFTILFPPSLGRVRAAARASLLAESLTHRFGEPVRVQVASSYAELDERVIGADVEIAWAPPAICARADKSAIAILKAIRRGQGSYRAALLGRAGELSAVGDLAGKRLAWVDPLSAGGHLLAIAHLRRHDLAADALASQRFHGSYQDALLAVLAGEADATSIYVDGDDEASLRRSLDEHVGPRGVELRAFAYTASTAADALIVTSRARGRRPLVDSLAPLTDGSRGPTLLLELLGADTLERAAPDDYREIRRALAGL